MYDLLPLGWYIRITCTYDSDHANTQDMAKTFTISLYNNKDVRMYGSGGVRAIYLEDYNSHTWRDICAVIDRES